MLFLILAALAGAGPGDAVEAAPHTRAPIVWRSHCDRGLARTAAYTAAELRKLGELPPGIMQLAVDKRVAGCGVTVLPRRDETGQHMMIMGSQPTLYRTPARSKPQRRLERDR